MVVSIATDSFNSVSGLIVAPDARGNPRLWGVGVGGGSYMQGFAVTIDVRAIDEKPHAVSVGYFTHFYILNKISGRGKGVAGVSTQLASMVK
jgi:hypothetical protein